MWFIIRAVILGVAAVAVAWWLASLGGTVTLTLGGFTIEVSTAIALVALAVALLVLLIILRGIRWMFGIGTRTGRWRHRRRRDGGDAAVTGSLLALAAGDAERARREADRARDLLGDTPQTLLLAAQSARLAGQEAVAADFYRQLAAMPQASLLGLRGLLRQAVAHEKWDEAAVLAGKAEAAYPGAPWLREERTLLAVRGGNWQQALALAAPDAPRASFAVAAAEAGTDPRDALRLARRTWKEQPGFAPAALAYARRLREGGREGRAQDVLRDAWTRTPQPDLAALALAPAADPAERVRRAQRLVSGRMEDPESHLLMARLQLEAGDMAAARRQLDSARKGGLDQRRVWLLQADLEARQGGDGESARLAQRDALRRAADAAADPTWRCESCGTALPEWRPVCPHCHTPGRVSWGAQTKMELLPPA